MSSTEQHLISSAIIKLMAGVVYRETHEEVWRTLERHPAPVRDHFAEIGVALIVDDLEGYAFLKSLDPEEGADPLPRLVQRRALTYHVSLLLLLLRKRLAEFEATGEEGKLVLQRDQLVEMLRVYLNDSTNETRVIQQVDQTIAQVAKLGFLHELRGSRQNAATGAWEVRRIVKAYIDAETMSDFAGRLAAYADAHGANDQGDDRE